MEKEWTKSQSNAIHADGCNILVSAAAGSGKTAVYLVEQKDASAAIGQDELTLLATFDKSVTATDTLVNGAFNFA